MTKKELTKELSNAKKREASLRKELSELEATKRKLQSYKMAAYGYKVALEKANAALLMAHESRIHSHAQKNSFAFRWVLPAKFIASLFRKNPKTVLLEKPFTKQVEKSFQT